MNISIIVNLLTDFKCACPIFHYNCPARCTELWRFLEIYLPNIVCIW